MLAVAAAVLAADQVAKEVVGGAIDAGEPIDLVLGFKLVDVSNRGIAFGLLGGGGAPVVLATAATLAVLLVWFALDARRPWLWLGVGLLVGGALGNLVDRVLDSGVTDFIDPPLWPAFNLADVAITFGVAALVLIALAPGDDAHADS
jgi:signal peptidase II